jgi:hypothetical protein
VPRLGVFVEIHGLNGKSDLSAIGRDLVFADSGNSEKGMNVEGKLLRGQGGRKHEEGRGGTHTFDCKRAGTQV